MTLTVNFINTDHSSEIAQFIESLVNRTFSGNNEINSLIVNLYAQNNNQVPWKCSIYLSDTSEQLINSESRAANYLTAFSQALMRIKRQWDKHVDLRA